MAPYNWKTGVLGCAGQLIGNTEAKVVKEDGSLADYDESGELYVRGPQNAIAYFNNEVACVAHLPRYMTDRPHSTKETFEDGWYGLHASVCPALMQKGAHG